MIPVVYFYKLGTLRPTLALPPPEKQNQSQKINQGMGDATTAKASSEKDKSQSIAQSKIAQLNATAATNAARLADTGAAQSSGNAIPTEDQYHHQRAPPVMLSDTVQETYTKPKSSNQTSTLSVANANNHSMGSAQASA